MGNSSSILFQIQPSLSPLLAPLTHLNGVGEKLSQLLSRAVKGERIIDLLFHLPENFIDRRYTPHLKDAIPGRIATLEVTVTHIEKPNHSKQPWRIHVTDKTANAELIFFSSWQARKMQIGNQLIVSGPLETYNNRLTLPHPHYIEPIEKKKLIPLIEPVWPLTAGLFPKNLHKALYKAFALCPDFPEWIHPTIIKQYQWVSFKKSLHLLHFPNDFPELFENKTYEIAANRARSRLAFDELFAEQLALTKIKYATRQAKGKSYIGDYSLSNQALKKFGFSLTNSQKKALNEIQHDLQQPYRMLRLLQGDVGSGKTIIALLSALQVVEAGYQAVIMAPTEILAQQHYVSFSQLSPVETVFLSASIKKNARKEALEKIKNGIAKITVGTHSLFQETVDFYKLGLAIIDEQHRFGVEQRLKLRAKGEDTDILVMTATPIPRTLLLTRWGDLQVSRITEKPAGRKAIRTTLHAINNIDKIIEAIARAINQGSQIFWVCPLIEESEIIDLAAAKDRFKTLQHYFGEDQVGLAHGRQDAHERQIALNNFAQNKTKILVATTVIEVGVDIPNANVIIIEHAERFGLAQLHQLRGRVGRGDKQSYCLLLHEDQINYTAKKRLTLLRDTEDGFLIADEDYRIRGGGEATGRRQSGLPDFRMVNEIQLGQFLTPAWQAAEDWHHQQNKANTAEKEAIQSLLTLFSKHDIENMIKAG